MKRDLARELGPLLTSLALVLLLSGCASRSLWVWDSVEGKSEAQFLEDDLDCQALARHEAGRGRYYQPWPCLGCSPNYWGADPFSPYYYDHSFHPFYGDPNLFFRYEDDLEQLYRVCMKAKGWQLVRKSIENEPRVSPDSRE